MITIEENIIKLFRMDTFIAAGAGITLYEYMSMKHGWTRETYNKYWSIYVKYLCDNGKPINS